MFIGQKHEIDAEIECARALLSEVGHPLLPAPWPLVRCSGQSPKDTTRLGYEARVSRSRRNHFHHNIGGCGVDGGGNIGNGSAAALGGSGASRCA